MMTTPRSGAGLRSSDIRRSGGAIPGLLPDGTRRTGGGLPGAAELARNEGPQIQPEYIPGVASDLPVLHLLVVDEDMVLRNGCMEIAAGMGFAVVGATDAVGARAILKHQKIDVMLLGLKTPGGGGLGLLEELKTLHPHTWVVVMTGSATVSSAVEAMRVGAWDYLTKPFALEDLTSVLLRAGERRQFDMESRRLRERLRNQRGAGPLIGRSPEMENLYRILSKVARSTHPVLIQGEAGTGKELIARAIHFNGPLAQQPFVPVDCASLVPTLIESELFGYVKGAFPGATRNKDGLLAGADGGTVFLDEVSELPLELQAKLLRALQDKEVHPVGSSSSTPISARILAASSRDLALMVEQGRFRKDLYFRLNVVNLKVPSLRDRRDDIGLLAMHFLDRIQKETNKPFTLSDEALRVLSQYPWPGNVRELENAIERACTVCSGSVLYLDDLPTAVQDFWLHGRGSATAEKRPVADADSSEKIVSIAEMERQAILGSIRQLKGDKLMAAKLLGIGKTTLYRKLKEYGVTEAEALD